MTEFTKDDIEHYRKQYALWTSRGRITPEELHLIGRLRDALDEIERLQDLMLAYENDLVLLSVYGKLKRAEERIAELEQERRWISVDEIKEAGLYAFINYHNGNNVGYFTPEYLNYYQKNHVKWVYRLPQPPQEKE